MLELIDPVVNTLVNLSIIDAHVYTDFEWIDIVEELNDQNLSVYGRIGIYNFIGK